MDWCSQTQEHDGFRTPNRRHNSQEANIDKVMEARSAAAYWRNAVNLVSPVSGRQHVWILPICRMQRCSWFSGYGDHVLFRNTWIFCRINLRSEHRSATWIDPHGFIPAPAATAGTAPAGHAGAWHLTLHRIQSTVDGFRGKYTDRQTILAVNMPAYLLRFNIYCSYWTKVWIIRQFKLGENIQILANGYIIKGIANS
jgi:hypothetical protein